MTEEREEIGEIERTTNSREETSTREEITTDSVIGRTTDTATGRTTNSRREADLMGTGTTREDKTEDRTEGTRGITR